MRTNLLLFEDGGWRQLLPLTWLRPAFELRCGVDRLVDKVVTHLGPLVFDVAVRRELEEVVRARTPLVAPDPQAPFTLVNSRLLVTRDIAPPPVGAAWVDGKALLAATFATRDEAQALAAGLSRAAAEHPDARRADDWIEQARVEPAPQGVRLLHYPWEPALLNRDELVRQWRGGAFEGRMHASAHVTESKNVRVAAGAVVKAAVVLDAEQGPVHIDAHAVIEPNAVLVGPCYIGPHSIVRPQATIREGVTAGPHCRIGGEISSSILHGYANKQHEGFLGHSYVGEWVNLGAGTITSNLKNTYGRIRVMLNGHMVDSGQQFIGTMFGDHAKTGIGTILPTGCVLGLSANVFTRAPVPKFVPSFAWLTDAGLTRFDPEKAAAIAQTVMGRRGATLSAAEARLLVETAGLASRVEAAGWAATQAAGE